MSPQLVRFRIQHRPLSIQYLISALERDLGDVHVTSKRVRPSGNGFLITIRGGDDNLELVVRRWLIAQNITILEPTHQR